MRVFNSLQTPTSGGRMVDIFPTIKLEKVFHFARYLSVQYYRRASHPLELLEQSSDEESEIAELKEDYTLC